MVTHAKFPADNSRKAKQLKPRGHGDSPPPKGKPFPKGPDPRRKPGGGRPRKLPEDVLAVLNAGNIEQLRNLWKMSFSKNESIALQACLAWLRKTIPDTDMLIIPGTKAGPTNVSDTRTQFKERLEKLFGLRALDDGSIVEGETVPSFPDKAALTGAAPDEPQPDSPGDEGGEAPPTG